MSFGERKKTKPAMQARRPKKESEEGRDDSLSETLLLFFFHSSLFLSYARCSLSSLSLSSPTHLAASLVFSPLSITPHSLKKQKLKEEERAFFILGSVSRFSRLPFFGFIPLRLSLPLSHVLPRSLPLVRAPCSISRRDEENSRC